MSKEKEDCSVSNALCTARMETLEEKIKSVKQAIYATGATITVVIAFVEFALRFWRP